MRWCWPWRSDVDVAADTTDEANAALAALDAREPEVRRLGRELREAQRRNHFSPMVADAIARVREQH